MSDNLKSIKARILALSNMTTENGCSEAEALAAGAKLTALLDEHGISISDIERGGTEETRVDKEFTDGRGVNHEVQFCAMAIASLFDCKVWGTRLPAGRRTYYFGFPQDTAAALAVHNLVRDAMDAEWSAWSREAKRDGRIATASVSIKRAFLLAMAQRINQRLGEMKSARAQPAAVGGGTALVVVKDRAVTEAFKATGLKLQSRSSASSGYDGGSGARAAGRAAGDRTNLSAGKGVGVTKKIGAN